MNFETSSTSKPRSVPLNRQIGTAYEIAKQHRHLALQAASVWRHIPATKRCVQFTGLFFAKACKGDKVMSVRLLCDTALLIIAGTASFAFEPTSQPATVHPTSDVSQFIKVGVTRVLVRYEWQWDRGAAGGGTWLAEQGVVTGVQPNWIVLRTDNTNRTLLIPFSAFKHIELLN